MRESLLESGQLTRFEDGSVWRVGIVTRGSAVLRCEAGAGDNRTGRQLIVSPSAVGHVIVAEDAVTEAALAASVLASQCDACWAKHEPGAPCPAECWCHDRKPRTVAPEVSEEEKAYVLKLRSEGFSFTDIEEIMEWPATKGARARKIVRESGANDNP